MIGYQSGQDGVVLPGPKAEVYPVLIINPLLTQLIICQDGRIFFIGLIVFGMFMDLDSVSVLSQGQYPVILATHLIHLQPCWVQLVITDIAFCFSMPPTSYRQCFDLEGEYGIVVRGIGTAVTLASGVLTAAVTSRPSTPIHPLASSGELGPGSNVSESG